MGLTLIQGNNERDTKPRVIVVAEPSVHDALSSDLELDVYPERFDYDSFVKASLSKSISTNNAIVVVSDSLSQRVAPLEAVIALVRKNIVLIPWKSTELEINLFNVAFSTGRPTANTLRRAIFEHARMKELPPRFDGDDFIEEPEDAHVMNFAPQGEAKQSDVHEEKVEEIITSQSSSPLDWFATPSTELPDETLQEQIYEQTDKQEDTTAEFLPPVEQQRIAEEERRHEQELLQAQVEVAQRSPTVQEDAPSFLPEFFSGAETQSDPEAAASSAPSVEEKNETRLNINSFWSQPETTSSSTTTPPSPSVPQEVSGPSKIPGLEHPYAQSDSLELEAYVSNSSDMDTYDFDDSSPSTFLPDVANSPIDKHGNQQMWTMFDSKIEHSSQANNPASLSEFPDGSDHRKAINLPEPLVLCVYSPKGGVGKTSISVNLAARLAYTTRLQVCIVDLDIAFGNVGTRLGLYNPTVRELLNESHIDGESLARNLVYDRRSGLFALLAPLRPETGTNRRKFSPAAYKKILSLLKERFDVVILDCPVELRDPLVSGLALIEAGKVVMVVNNEQATLLDARRALEAMCRPKDSQRLPGLGLDPTTVGMVVNQKVDNVGREVEDIKAILGGGDPNHPSKKIDILSVISDDRQLWVGNANMARTVATSGENDVDQLLDDIWGKILPSEAASEFESQQFNSHASSPLDDILSRDAGNVPKKKRKMNPFKK